MGKQRRPYNWSNSMLTTDDREEIKRLMAEMMEPGRKCGGLRFDQPAASSTQTNYAEEIEQIDVIQNTVARLSSLVEVTARAIEVFGTREKALRWLRTPVRALGRRQTHSRCGTGSGWLAVDAGRRQSRRADSCDAQGDQFALANGT